MNLKINHRQAVQIAASLRYWGRAAETSTVHPMLHPMVRGRFSKECWPLTLDEIEGLIGRIDGTLKSGGRTWSPGKWL
jgi:hypothetical protein